MKNRTSIWFTINSVVNYFIGVLYSFTLILLPIGIYCFICAMRNNHYAKLSEAQLASIKEQVKGWTIFSSIACFPIGLISIIPFCLIGSNGIKITSVENSPVNQTEDEVLSISEIDEKIAKLTHFRKEGIISEEEYQKAIDELKNMKD